MYMTLTIFAALLGLLVTGAAVFTAWQVFTLQRAQQNPDRQEAAAPSAQDLKRTLLRWTFFDYATLVVTLTGLLFLLADLIGVVRDREMYPYYHYGYLMCGFIFSCLGLLFLLSRLFVVLRLASQGTSLALPEHHDEPDQTH